MGERHQIYLIPGFFGFANFGEIKYFAHVRQRLERMCADRGLAAEIHYVRTLPTASLSRRAARLADTIAATGDREAVLHLVGHSTGGIDARLLVSPNVTLPTAVDLEAIAERVCTVTTIASPHYGAPQAAVFTGVAGQSLLRALSILTLHGIRLGSVPISALVATTGALGAVLPQTRRMQGPVVSVLDQVYRQLLKDFDDERQADIESFFADTSEDQALLSQLTPDGMDVFNAATTTRTAVRYGCVVTRARPPQWRAMLSIGMSPTAQATYALFRALHRLASSLPESAAPTLTAVQIAALRRAYGDLPDTAANDAIVPTLSQVFGEVVHATWADHLDVIGHFADPRHDPPHVDWLLTRSEFDRRRFAELWTAIGGFLFP